MLMCQFWSRLLILPNEIIVRKKYICIIKKSYSELNKLFRINELYKLRMELFTRETIGNYTSDPYAKNDHKYSKEMQEVRKELRKLDQETKKDGGVVDWNRMLNDFM